jgi:iturin family lipopeptide synthetase B
MAKKAEIQNIYPLTPMQQGMLFNYLFNRDSKAYFQQLSFLVEADLDINIFEMSVNKVIERYDIFRSIFIYEKVEEPKQVVLTKRSAKIHYEDISYMESSEQKRYLDEFKEKDRSKSFDLSKDLLMRIAVMKVGTNDYEIVWSHHHIVIDGWCLGLVISDFIKIYKSLRYGEEHKLAKAYQYVDYINWLVKQDNNEASGYWKNYLEDYENDIVLPQKAKAKAYEYDKKEIHFTINKELTSKIVDICRKANVTVNNAFQAIWAIVLQRYNNIDDVVFGAVVSGRNAPIEGIEKMIGLFINTIPIRVNCDGNLAFTDLLMNIRDLYNQSTKYDFVSLAQIQSACNVKQNLINNLYIFENYPARDMNTSDTYKIKDATSFEQTNYDFNIVILPSDEIHIKLKYNALIYDDKVVESIKDHIMEIVNCISNNPEICIKDIRMLTHDEYDQVVYWFNQNQSKYPYRAIHDDVSMLDGTTIHELFEAQVEKTPDNYAVVYKNHAITYKELNEKANSVARVLREMGVNRDTIVALITERSIEMIIGILSILKAGGAYLPIDQAYPVDRVNYMLGDSKANILITNIDYNELLFQGNIIDLRDSALYANDPSNLENINFGNDLAYIIYTSGTTGKPKGVMIENRSVINLSMNINKNIYQEYHTKLNVALLSPYVFDASVKQIFPAILHGHTLVIIPEEERLDGDKLVNYYIEHNIDISDGTPAHLSIIRDMLIDKNIELPAKHFVIGGEELFIDLVRNFFEVNPKKELKITNVYGPTECCDVSTMYEIDCDKIESLTKIPIGNNLDNVQIYILDKYRNPVPIYTPGEIYISGEGLSRGYMNQRELTEERFVTNPFIEGSKMYRTGDLGKRLMNGEIEYLGRIDQQIKIRGFRIELEEIEKQIREFTDVKEAAVVCGESAQGSKYIAAFVVSNTKINLNDLRTHLSKSLPNYMIPTYIMNVDKIPVTHNGKIDKKQLIELLQEEQVQYVPPRNHLEEIVADVWSEILDVDTVGIRDNFFDLGGDDSSAIRMVMELQKHNIELKVSDLRLYSTIEKLGEHIKFHEGIASEQIVTGDVELTPIQKDFFERSLNHKDRWNQAFCLYKKEGFNEKIVKQAFDKIVEHHDALRMRFSNKEGKVLQYNAGINDNSFTFDIYDFTDCNNLNLYENIEKVANSLQGGISLSKGPLVKLGLFKTKEGDHLLIIIHHLVVDGVSWRIILEDFATGYKQLSSDENICLAGKTDSFKQWADELMLYSKSEELFQELEYWRGINEASRNQLTRDQQVSVRRFRDIRTEELILSKEQTTNLLKNVHKAYGTQANEILLSILGLALQEWNGLDKVLINLEGHGREEIIKDINIKRTVGWFTSFYPVVLDMNEGKDLENYINRTKDSLRNVPNKGIGFGILKYMSKLDGADKKSFQYKPEINFNYLGQFGDDSYNEVFTLSDAPIGDCVDINDETQYALNIICKVINKQLSISFRYDCNEFKEENIAKLKAVFNEKQKEVITHCMDITSRLTNQQTSYCPPRNHGEKELIEIWESVLGISRIGIYDDFFELGGDSIKAIKILSKANNLKLPVSVKAILEYRTVANIMEHCDKDNSLEIYEGSAAALQNDSVELIKKRVYNKDFHVTTEYPSYYGCMTGVILEKLKHERKVNLERSFLAVGGGKFYVTYGHVNNKGLQNTLQYRELPTEMIPGVVDIFDELGVTEEVKSFKDLEEGLAYCREHLRNNELVMISGTTYYLNYTPDYCIGEEEWRRRLDIRPENIIAVTDKSSGRAHTFLLVDILEDGYLVYDTTFKYYGVIPTEDFNKSFAGLRGMRFLDGIYAQTTNLPYAVTDLDLSKINQVDNRQVALEVLQNNIDINLSNKRIDFKTNENDFTFYIGIRAYLEIASMIRANKTHEEKIKKLISSCFGSWKYKFMFFKEFLEDLSKYIELPKEYIDYCDRFIKECMDISSLFESNPSIKSNPSDNHADNVNNVSNINTVKDYNHINVVDMEELFEDTCRKLETIYEQQTIYFKGLKTMIEDEKNSKGDKINVGK